MGLGDMGSGEGGRGVTESRAGESAIHGERRRLPGVNDGRRRGRGSRRLGLVNSHRTHWRLYRVVFWRAGCAQGERTPAVCANASIDAALVSPSQ